MACERIYTHEEIADGEWAVINETSWTGHAVLFGLGRESSEFYTNLMNEVHNQCKKDYQESRWDKE
jgi:hypothetical protein